jgi:hypothetical protein
MIAADSINRIAIITSATTARRRLAHCRGRV